MKPCACGSAVPKSRMRWTQSQYHGKCYACIPKHGGGIKWNICPCGKRKPFWQREKCYDCVPRQKDGYRRFGPRKPPAVRHCSDCNTPLERYQHFCPDCSKRRRATIQFHWRHKVTRQKRPKYRGIPLVPKSNDPRINDPAFWEKVLHCHRLGMDCGRATRHLVYEWMMPQDSDGNTMLTRDYGIKPKAMTKAAGA